jgi:recombination associated protein RdgC
MRFFAEPPSRLDRDAVARAVSRRAFRDQDAGDDADGPPAAASFGWVGIHDPLAVELTPADLFFQHYLVLGFRFDRRVVPPKLLWLERRRAEARARAEQGTPRLGAAVRRQIKTEVETRLLLRALPAPRLYDCVWNLDSGRVYLSGRERLAREAFSGLFRDTFGVTPVPLIPYLAAEHVGLPPEVVSAVRAVEPTRLVPEADAAVPRLPLEEARA